MWPGSRTVVGIRPPKFKFSSKVAANFRLAFLSSLFFPSLPLSYFLFPFPSPFSPHFLPSTGLGGYGMLPVLQRFGVAYSF